jgi:hypothetical protein
VGAPRPRRPAGPLVPVLGVHNLAGEAEKRLAFLREPVSPQASAQVATAADGLAAARTTAAKLAVDRMPAETEAVSSRALALADATR